jgi:uncharacterized protein
MRILAIGQSVRNVACSASRAGHDVVAADYYCDLDLQECASEAVTIPSLPEARECVLSCIDKFRPEAVVLGPGFEDVEVRGTRSLNNPPERFSTVSDKLWLAKWLQAKGFPSIPTFSPEDIDNRYKNMIVKPRKGAGGIGCRKISDLSLWNSDGPNSQGFKGANDSSNSIEHELIIQEYVEGLPASASVICNGKDAVTISVNEQLVGEPWAGAMPFRYSGNITPLDTTEKLLKEIARLAEEVVSGLKLVGSNGVDFILSSKGPVVVEVNPRFQGSLDSVELATGMNVFQAHLDSIEGFLPEPQSYRKVAGRAVIYSQFNIRIERDLRELVDYVADVPRLGSTMNRDDPVASVLACSAQRGDVLELLKTRASMLKMALC